MLSPCVIIRSKHPETISVCQDISNQIGLTIHVEREVATFMLDLQDEDYQAAVFDFDHSETEAVNWVKFIRRLRPKIPLIVFCDDVDKNSEAQMYEASILYLGLRPLDKELLLPVFGAALKKVKGV